jgi:hypothetical protein
MAGSGATAASQRELHCPLPDHAACCERLGVPWPVRASDIRTQHRESSLQMCLSASMQFQSAAAGALRRDRRGDVSCSANGPSTRSFNHVSLTRSAEMRRICRLNCGLSATTAPCIHLARDACICDHIAHSTFATAYSPSANPCLIVAYIAQLQHTRTE